MSRLLVIAGPTASGKTEVAYEISKRLPTEMISCDSMQVYRGMPILTNARKSGEGRGERGQSKIHLISFLDPCREEYSAARFRKDAEFHIRRVLKKKKMPLLVGGTGLYLRTLLDGLFEADAGSVLKDETLRRKLILEEEKNGSGFLHKKLQKVDAPSAARIHPNDTRRVVRALEVYQLTQKPFSSQKERRKGLREELGARIFLIDRDREDLYRRINARVNRMMRGGLAREVKGLLRKNLSLTARMALGIREIEAHLQGKLTLEEAKLLLMKNTRNYAKRQLSWFRHEKGVEPIEVSPDEPASVTAGKILNLWEIPSA